jgi:protocatechuate 3,4-dioxygenase, beta subunit
MDIENMKVTRRRAIGMAMAAGGGAIVGSSQAFAQVLPATPEEIAGPFYPIIRPLDEDWDLTRVRGRDGAARGQVFHLVGRVLDSKGLPVKRARIEMWQANTHGRYDHASDPNVAAPLDPYFQGYAVEFTDDYGRYHFKTVKPGAYPATPTWTRTPHIHFDIRGKHDRLITQLYFTGEPLNASDQLFQALGKERDSVLVQLAPSPDVEPGSLLGTWNIVLNKG